MCYQFAKSICIFLLACTFVCAGKTTLAGTFVVPVVDKGESQSPVRLTLKTTQRKYRVGEPIDVLGYLENRSDESYYVGNTLIGFWATSELHELHLRIFDANNKEVMIGGGGGSWIWKPNTSVAEKIAQAYTHLRPDMILGIKETIPIELRAGRYRLTATYREIEASYWTEAERKALAIPVWTQPLTSNTVIIKVAP